MKTTIDLPDPLFRRVKVSAAAEGLSLKAFITEAVEGRLRGGARPLSAVLDSLPQVPTGVLTTVRERVDESNREDLKLQGGTEE
jgi:hypothetical protein